MHSLLISHYRLLLAPAAVGDLDADVKEDFRLLFLRLSGGLASALPGKADDTPDIQSDTTIKSAGQDGSRTCS